ncbi:MAG: ABC transporter substrate-binding protein [Acidimicrobiaceae bacterium]|nr:ABC transporter substrate-binding protein [Acidimicrobiaceae bacterium]
MSFVRRRHKLLSGAAALAFTAALGACSSSNKPASSGTTATTSASSATTASSAKGAPIKVGVICTCSGAFGADVKDAADVYQAWANTVNASGGLNGHPVQVTLKDDAANPGTSTSDIQTLISDHVVAIADLSIVDQVWASTIQSAGIPVVGANETENPFYQNPDFYSEGQTNDSVTFANVATAKASGAKSLGQFYCAEAPSCAEGVPLIKAQAQRTGIRDAYNAVVSATAPNYTAQCVAAQQAHVAAVFIGDSSVVINRIAADCDRQGYDPIYLTEGEGFGMNMAAAPGVSKNLWSEYSQVPFFDNIPAIRTMNAAVDKYYPGLRNNDQVWSELAVEGWSSGLLLADAVKAGGLSPGATPSTTEIVQGLHSLKGDTLQGTAPPLTFSGNGPHHIDCWFTARVQNGKPSMVNNGQVSCENGSSA